MSAAPERRLRLRPVSDAEPWASGDFVEYRLSYHVEADGVEAWVTYGGTSQVRADETGHEADQRIRRHVEREVVRRARQAVEGL